MHMNLKDRMRSMIAKSQGQPELKSSERGFLVEQRRRNRLAEAAGRRYAFKTNRLAMRRHAVDLQARHISEAQARILTNPPADVSPALIRNVETALLNRLHEQAKLEHPLGEDGDYGKMFRARAAFVSKQLRAMGLQHLLERAAA